MMLKVKTTRFGDIEVDGTRAVRFPDGLLGFPEQRDFVILDHKADSPFCWLQSIDTPELAFVLTNPFLVKGNYLEDLPPQEAHLFKNDDGSHVIVFTLVTIPPGNVKGMTVNLLGPLVIDTKTRVGRQVILSNSGYNHRHPLIST